LTNLIYFSYIEVNTEIKNLLQSNPSDYTPWFKIDIPKIEEHLAGQIANRHSVTSFH
jgi:hypothetical protein